MGAVEYALTGVVAHPLGSLRGFVFLHRDQKLVADGLSHHVLHFAHPVLYVLLVGVYDVLEVDLLLFCGKHSFNVLPVVELNRVDVFEHFLEMRLHCCWLLCLGKNFKQIIIRQEIESCKSFSLLL